MIGSASPSQKHVFNVCIFLNRPAAWNVELALFFLEILCDAKSSMQSVNLHTFHTLVTTASSSHQSFSKIWHWDGSCLCKIVLEFDEHEFILEWRLESNRKSQSVWRGFDVWRYQRPSRQKESLPYASHMLPCSFQTWSHFKFSHLSPHFRVKRIYECNRFNNF